MCESEAQVGIQAGGEALSLLHGSQSLRSTVKSERTEGPRREAQEEEHVEETEKEKQCVICFCEVDGTGKSLQ